MAVTHEEFKNRLITEGIASVNEHEKRDYRKRGCLAGFELCRSLNSIWDFEEELKRRHEHERELVSHRTFNGGDNSVQEYWEYRCATVQVEYVYERMLVVWSQMGLYSGPLSARAVIRTAEIVGVE
jgi:hypothetical protein